MPPLVAIFGGIIFWGNYETTSLLCATVHGFDYVNHLLLIVERPIDLVVVPSAEVDHDMFITKKEHDCTGIVQLIHGVEIWYFRDIYHCQKTIGKNTHV